MSLRHPIHYFLWPELLLKQHFTGNNVERIKSLAECYKLAKNAPGTIVTDIPVERPEEIGLEQGAKVLLFNDGAVTGRTAAARRIAGEPGVDVGKICGEIRDAVYAARTRKLYHASAYIGLHRDFMVKANLLIPESHEMLMYTGFLISSTLQMSILKCIVCQTR